MRPDGWRREIVLLEIIVMQCICQPPILVLGIGVLMFLVFTLFIFCRGFFHIFQMMPRLLSSASNLTSPFEPLDFTARGDKVRVGGISGASESCHFVQIYTDPVRAIGLSYLHILDKVCLPVLS